MRENERTDIEIDALARPTQSRELGLLRRKEIRWNEYLLLRLDGCVERAIGSGSAAEQERIRWAIWRLLWEEMEPLGILAVFRHRLQNRSHSRHKESSES